MSFNISATSHILEDARETAENLFPSVFGMYFKSELTGCFQHEFFTRPLDEY